MTTGLDGLRRFVDTCNDEETLSALNKALIDKLRELTNERTRRSMLSFRKGMRVAFRTGKKQGRYLVVGTIERMNVETVSLEHDYCGSCVGQCDRCDEHYCTNCIQQCEVCGNSACSGCMTSCPDCGRGLCEACLEEQECPCKEEEEDDDEQEDGDAQAEERLASAAPRDAVAERPRPAA